ncbi:hypothetical protein [Paenibacillus sp. SN-8-1]
MNVNVHDELMINYGMRVVTCIPFYFAYFGQNSMATDHLEVENYQ